MTGEITLSGRATAIGGVREKVIAALRAGVYDVILPAENEKDLEEIPEEVRSRLRFKFVESASEVIDFAVPRKIPKITDPAPASRTMPDEIYTFRIPDRAKAENAEAASVGKDEKQPETGGEKNPAGTEAAPAAAEKMGNTKKTCRVRPKKRKTVRGNAVALPPGKRQTDRRRTPAWKPVKRRYEK